MILQFDEGGNLIATTYEVYPVDPETFTQFQKQPGFVVDMPPFEPSYWHYHNGSVQMKPLLDIVVSEKPFGAQLEGVPRGADIIVTGDWSGEGVGDGDVFEIEFAQAGTYVIQVNAVGFQPFRYSVRVS